MRKNFNFQWPSSGKQLRYSASNNSNHVVLKKKFSINSPCWSALLMFIASYVKDHGAGDPSLLD